ncbi:SURP and G-patch domain-containing protein 1 isoform X1 [Scaptodrosophila lebanonensis]|uniref:SURP and G-patch domain-containing protein 1 isoform X1 n=1 Tax=Drosophila lebanonensis TaxID=7225 RepID=A0A6J2TGC3_DROLE|nr:SURP and G-patch domain-containing protein 1 isoform X1 [Scaptodrosophila lebanonensis]
MAQRNQRVDRFAQMTKQEEIIAKKRQEILEKQRTAQLAKAVAAAQTHAQTLAASAKPKESEEQEEPVVPAPTIEDSASELDNSDAASKAKGDETPKTLNSFNSKTGKITFGLKRQQLPQPSVEQPPPKVMNTFCNDGSFLENFKKILEKHEQPKPPIIVAPVPVPSMDESNNITDTQGSDNNSPKLELSGPAPTTLPVVTSIASVVTTSAPNHLAFSMPATAMPPSVQPPPPPPPFAFNPALLPQGPPQLQLPAFFHGHLPMQLHPAAVAPPPPPPPPQLPLALASLTPIYMQLGPPPPEPIQMNAIPAPKDFDLASIPKPQMNLEAIQMPTVGQSDQLNVTATPPPPPPPLQQEQHPHQQQLQHQQQQQHQQHQQLQQQQQQHSTPPPQVFSETYLNDIERSNCIKLPTCIENLIALVAENGEDYEDKIRLHRSELHPALWFLYDKNCEQYRNYRGQLLDYERQRAQRKQQQQQQQQEQHQQQLSNPQALAKEQDNPRDQDEHNSNSAADKYDPESAISADFDSDDEYMRGMMDRNRDNIKRRIECRNELSDEERREREEAGAGADADDYEETQRQRRKRERKSRWGEKEQSASSTSGNFANQNKPMLSVITRNDPALLQYARLNYGSTQLSEEQWKQCEEHYKVNLLYQDMMRKRQEIDRLARTGKFKYEYDSDEDVEGGTWEHKLRTAEMEATHLWANALTKQSEGKHHIGDFLPPEELKKFMEQYEAKKNNRQPDLSDYKEYKLKEDNIGFQMLQKLGWKEGQGLGQDGAGIVDPVNKAPQRDGNQGLGVNSAAQPEDCDNEYDAYRKRMMLAYRFRPNPLNNPRRAYY